LLFDWLSATNIAKIMDAYPSFFVFLIPNSGYDMTTLYFEASDEEDLPKAGFSKDGKHSNPQIFIELLVGSGGYSIGYDLFEGNTYEGHTLIPFLEKMSGKFNLGKPVVIADPGLLSKPNIRALEENGYGYIIGTRLKSENAATQEQVIRQTCMEGTCYTKPPGLSSIIQSKGQRRMPVIGGRDSSGLKSVSSPGN
jgi:transposase